MRFLSNKEKKELENKLPKGYEINKKGEIKEGNDSVIYNANEKFLIIKDDKYIPHLKSVDDSKYSSVYVDKGAIPFVIKGADLMRPGIQKIEDNINKNDIILVKDENHNKTIAIGISMFSSEDMQNQEKGKSVKIIHYVGDSYY
ncbi:MAG: DUF1947 domain-containing protein [Candidatus Woesearchaeota archaeon]|jgi:PUA-domain protein|nr:DUF1947 domain-containing protein [Candidatus Woesearchaeota archaeon]